MIHSCRSTAPGQRGFPIAREGYPFILGSALVAVIVAVLGLYTLALFFLAVTSFVSFFFRDPERVVPEQPGVLVSPADGKVIEVRLSRPDDLADEKMLKISIFMSVFNVHVNRMPERGRITNVTYYPGKFFSANLDKASKNNERNAVSLEISGGRKLLVVQIAGLIARRIVCRVREGDHLGRGERFGLIRFGSRLEVYLPQETVPAVSIGDKVLAGSSVLGHLS
ncbi:MAG: phosphatidylserine decarboxylase family protein [Deltaproteobacteria bacterium]|nr:phosphatidylserine decarboxylase family protein [Deltaproteobacteria bacterium]MBW2171285.1 phosphatidylserine decarboxylase family protein [Deltaproteobacteria bacterium]MBW2259123.1 phosphatidylserine decarboxylase family protein [Deltaproteobacteria bacterium]